MKEYFSHLFKYSNQLVARSKEKSERLKLSSSISSEEHARVVEGMNQNHSAEIKRIQEAKNKAMKELRDANEKLEKKLKDADSQMVDSMMRIKDLSAELQDFKEASKLLIDLVDPVVVEATEERSLLSRLQEATQKLSAYVLSTVKSYLLTALGLVKAWHVDRLGTP